MSDSLCPKLIWPQNALYWKRVSEVVYKIPYYEYKKLDHKQANLEISKC
jgi:hypothetical protein